MPRDYDADPVRALPARFDDLVGRRDDVSLIRRLLQSSVRVVTVTGAAGVGKSRVAIAAAEGLVRSVSGVWHVEVRERAPDVATAVAHELKVPTEGDPVEAVVDALADRLDRPAEVTAEDVGEGHELRERVAAGAGGDIAGARHLHRRDPHPDLPRPGRGVGDVLQAQDVLAAELAHRHGAHRQPPSGP